MVTDNMKSDLQDIRIVSVGVVAYNEARVIDGVLNDLKSQMFQHERIEILLIDSASEDSTKEHMLLFASENDQDAMGFHAVRVLDNPKRIQAAGWNVAIREFGGDALIRVDAHATIAPDFVEKNVAVLNSGECVCGGFRPTVIAPGSETPWSEILHLAEESAFGSSVAAYRREIEARYVNSLFHGAYRRCVLDEVKGFNEELLRTEDNDFHYRIRKAGYQIRLDPSIRSAQFVRSSLKKMLKQKYENGYWVGRTVFVQPECLEIYHFAPLLFVLSIALLMLIGLFATWLPFVICGLLYFALCVLLSLRTVSGSWKKTVRIAVLPLVFFGIHFSYGIGTLVGLLEGLAGKDR